MPAEYLAIKKSVKQQLLKKGKSEEEADKEAKRIAAATFNKRHPKHPVGPHSD